MGEVLDREKFRLCYDKVYAERERHFALLDKDGNTELYVVFADIDEFAQNVEERVDFTFQVYKERLIGILWTKTDARDPLGFPFIFHLHDERERYRAIRLLEQEKIPVHYLAQNEDGALIHVFSETIAVPLPERQAAAERLEKSCFAGKGIEAAAGDAIGTKKASALSEGDLLARGTAYYLDWTALLLRYGEEEAKEKTMDLLSQALLVVMRHPRSDVREGRLIVWAGEKPRERERDAGEKRETRGNDESAQRFLLGIYVTPELTNWFSPPKRGEDENPFTRFLLFLPEYLCSATASPLQEGAYPLMEYDGGTLYALELDQAFQEKARSLFASAFAGLPNPYEKD
ncbi:hypothetical protein BSNK01_13160 [Bacillaceae bacterium]